MVLTISDIVLILAQMSFFQIRLSSKRVLWILNASRGRQGFQTKPKVLCQHALTQFLALVKTSALLTSPNVLSKHKLQRSPHTTSVSCTKASNQHNTSLHPSLPLLPAYMKLLSPHLSDPTTLFYFTKLLLSTLCPHKEKKNGEVSLCRLGKVSIFQSHNHLNPFSYWREIPSSVKKSQMPPPSVPSGVQSMHIWKKTWLYPTKWLCGCATGRPFSMIHQ